MVISRSVGQFFTVVTDQTLGGTVSAQDAFRRCMDRCADAGNAYVAAWDAIRRAGLLATFHFQDAVVRACQTVLVSGFQASPSACRRPRTDRLWPDPTLKLTASGTRLIHGSAEPGAVEASRMEAGDRWAESALRFQPPLGVVAPEYFGRDDEC